VSSVRYVIPKNKLGAQLRIPGGLPVAEALEAAHANLAELRPQCLMALQALTRDAQACFQRFPAAFSPEALKALYAIAARGVGTGSVCGAPAVDATLISLCDLLDHLRATERWDREAVSVHVQTLNLLVLGAGHEMDEAAANAILAGLKKVSARYAQPQVEPALPQHLGGTGGRETAGRNP
jgi:hypothetical protein